MTAINFACQLRGRSYDYMKVCVPVCVSLKLPVKYVGRAPWHMQIIKRTFRVHEMSCQSNLERARRAVCRRGNLCIYECLNKHYISILSQHTSAEWPGCLLPALKYFPKVPSRSGSSSGGDQAVEATNVKLQCVDFCKFCAKCMYVCM